ncbi:UL3.5 [Gallid alphaherpesvirus 2]|uniref:UL3.5 n=2 Tax=Gallid alphaherpesvirus 2 TaxID=10390 RepID=Q19BF1_9ALPH|nr:protein V57 [Gallid alphaherpesvirus 2]ACR02763.1 UL3.5 [synthetic construct]AEV54983.1 UL3.5 [Gallid herpesvirus 2 strain 814]ABF72236.1 HSV-1 UL3.5-like protein [Gallid alphaherpesvirus 2]ABR13079.1 UL3.5 [Gallid alphaherpesvirus 2]ACF94869.1 UL3.5 [Gallid alphaherpesvirus 2]
MFVVSASLASASDYMLFLNTTRQAVYKLQIMAPPESSKHITQKSNRVSKTTISKTAST